MRFHLFLILVVVICHSMFVSAAKNTKKKNSPAKNQPKRGGLNLDSLLKDAQKLLKDLDTEKMLESLSKDGEMANLIERTKKLLGNGPGEFDREFKNVLDSLSGKKGEKCEFKCNNKKMSPVPKAGWVPRHNGCGVEGLSIPADQMDYDFTQCTFFSNSRYSSILRFRLQRARCLLRYLFERQDHLRQGIFGLHE